MDLFPFSVFSDRQTIKAKKVSSTFSFPAELSMRRILSEPSQPELLYELSSFVQHYGNAVDHGHYVAHIKDENTGQWWRFNDKIVTKDSQSSLTKTFSSEDHYFEEIQTSNATYQKKYNQRKEKESSLINERTEEVRSVLSEASVQSLSQPFFWISCDWLRQWAKNVTPSAIDNTAITCSHGKVPVSKVTSMKRLSSKAWETLLEKYGGGPKLSHEDCCLDCLKEGSQNVMSADTYRDRRESFKQLAWDILDGKNEDGKYYVSRSWLLQWSIGEIPDAPSEANSNPTSDITCSHRQLLPEHATGPKRVLVPKDFWHSIYKDANSVKNDVVTFPSDSKECLVCCRIFFDMFQKKLSMSLFMGKCVKLNLNSSYFLVPTSWISKWRNYINPDVKNSDTPETLNVAINSLLCEKHARLIERPPELILSFGVLTLRESSACGLTLITEEDWKCFCKEWDTEIQGVSAEFENMDNMNNEFGNCQVLIKTCPEVVKENQILEKGGITIDNSDEYTTLVDLNIFAGDQIILVNEKKDTQYSEEGYRGTLLTSNVSSQGRTSMQKPPDHFNVQDLSVKTSF
ncbi:Ubiquitin carboxyl-terminal hydrolase 26 [Trifolium repens]|nr:Ubiquitin carboxyl-terminal hydrolase 26 [Trifolium repens]